MREHSVCLKAIKALEHGHDKRCLFSLIGPRYSQTSGDCFINEILKDN